MKLIRFGAVGNERPGVQLEDGTRLDVSAFGQDYNEDFFGGDGHIEGPKCLFELEVVQFPCLFSVGLAEDLF